MGTTGENASAEPRKYVVYGLVDPRDGSIRYVGRTKSLKARLAFHLCETDYGQGEARRAWFRNLRESGAWPPSHVVLRRGLSFEEADDAEGAWIELGLDLGWPLTNALKRKKKNSRASTSSEAA